MSPCKQNKHKIRIKKRNKARVRKTSLSKTNIKHVLLRHVPLKKMCLSRVGDINTCARVHSRALLQLIYILGDVPTCLNPSLVVERGANARPGEAAERCANTHPGEAAERCTNASAGAMLDDG